MTSNLIVLIGATMADRFLYVPSLGFCLVVTYFWARFLDVPDGKSASLSFANPKYFPVYILLALYSYKTHTRNEDWHDNLSLFTTDVRSSPGSARAHYNAGTEMLARFVVPNPDKNADTRKNAIRAAISELETAVKIDSSAFLYHLNLASAYSFDDNYTAAAQQASVAIRISEADPRPFVVLGSAYGSLNQFGKALEVFKRGLDLHPSDPRLNQLTGKTYEILGDTAAAKRYYGLVQGKRP
jgi:tetratricopeptide (TPR) repeat protein